MKKQIIEIIKVLLGLLVGSSVVVGMIHLLSLYAGGFGGMVFLPFIAFIIIFITLLIYRTANKTMFVIVSFIGGTFFYYTYYYQMICNPNQADIKVMTPMAQAISNYIVKNGIPESLKDIPDLPYRLVGCKRKVEYSNFDPNKLTTKIVNSKEKVDFYYIAEKCTFLYSDRTYYIKLDVGLPKDTKDRGRGSIDIGNWESHTWASLGFSLNSTRKVTIEDSLNFGSSKTDGICTSLRQ